MVNNLVVAERVAPNVLTGFGERTRALYKLVGYTPTPDQGRVLRCPARSIIVTGGIQAGKSTVISKKILKEFLPDLRRALERAARNGADPSTVLPIIYWLVGADYDATEREFRYVESDFQELGLLKRTVKKYYPGTLEILGGEGKKTVIAQIKTKSAKDFQTLRKEGPSGIAACEGSQLDIFAFERLTERQAPAEAWLMMTGTMERGKTWYSQLAREWGLAGPDKAWFQIKSSGNTYTFPGGEDNPELQRQRSDMPKSLYEERFEGIPQTPTGAVFPEFQVGLHVASVEYLPDFQVQVWEDPGFGSESAHVILAVQIVDSQVRVFDEIYVNGIPTDSIIKDILRQKEWYRDIEFRIGDPHYGSQRHGGKTSVDDIWKSLEPQIQSKGKRERLNPRLERTRAMLIPDMHGAPKVVIHPRCQGILSELGLGLNPIDKREHLYLYKVDSNGEIQGDEPIDKYNHGWEAFGRGAYFNFGPIGDVSKVAGTGRKYRSSFFGRNKKHDPVTANTRGYQ